MSSLFEETYYSSKPTSRQTYHEHFNEWFWLPWLCCRICTEVETVVIVVLSLIWTQKWYQIWLCRLDPELQSLYVVILVIIVMWIVAPLENTPNRHSQRLYLILRALPVPLLFHKLCSMILVMWPIRHLSSDWLDSFPSAHVRETAKNGRPFRPWTFLLNNVD